MKILEPLILTEEYTKEVEQVIDEIFWETLYKPLRAALRGTAIKLQNDNDPLSEALAKGKIFYSNGRFFGEFNSKISRQLRALGAFNSKNGWKLSPSEFTPAISSALALADSRFVALNDNIIKTLDKTEYNDAKNEALLNKVYDRTTAKMDAAFKKSVQGIRIAPKLTDEMKAQIAEQWSENLGLYIKGYLDENILALREEVRRNAFSGQRAENLVKLIQKNFGSSKKKATFLAKQETGLLMSKFRESRFKSVGVVRYRWSTSRDGRVREDHKELDGKIYSWDTPPPSGTNGENLNPGEPFGCRCIAVPIIDEE